MRKKYLIYIGMAALGFAMMGCDDITNRTATTTELKQTEAVTGEDENAGEVSEEQTTEENTMEQKETAIKPVIEIKDVEYDAGENSAYFEGKYQVAEVMSDDYPELKDSIKAWFEDFVSGYESEAAETVQNALIDKETFGEDFTNYAMDYKTSVERADNRVVSLSKFEYTFNGGVHGNYMTYGITFDTKTGQEINFEDLGDIKADVRKCADECVAQKREEGYLLEMYEDAVDNLLEQPAWYLNEEGLVIIFNPYEIGSYAEGDTMVTVPYEKMTNFNTEYLLEAEN